MTELEPEPKAPLKPLTAPGDDHSRRRSRTREVQDSRARPWMSWRELIYNQKAWLQSPAVIIQQLLAVLGLATGVALLFASQVASTTLNSSVSALTAGIVGSTQFQLNSGNPEGFSQQLVPRVERLPGIKTALPLLEQSATAIGPKGEVSV